MSGGRAVFVVDDTLVNTNLILEICGCGPTFSFASPKEKVVKRKRARRDFDFTPDLLEPTRKTPSVFLDVNVNEYLSQALANI